MKRKTLFALAMVGFLCVGCAAGLYAGGQKQSDTETSAAAEPVELSIWGWTRAWLLEPAVENYKKMHPNIDFEITIIPFGDLWKKLAVALPSGQGPDMFWEYTEQIGPHATAGLLAEMPKDLFPQSFIDQIQTPDVYGLIEGKWYTLPWAAQNSVMFYNKKFWAEAAV